ncbi:LPS assembly lipoprotein LptE [Roseimarinus sediminis]|jgi:hypothetical protein|uniref:LPS assembly lipoprotein LptE n=1 Tax=Roseimarinus sediminis TaxID=1610899 RepID=UPI003D199E49
MKQFLSIILFVFLSLGLTHCKINYSFTGASISPLVKTYTVYDFQLRAGKASPTLSTYFTEQLRDKFTRQTSLDYLRDGGDLEFEGAITGFDEKPMAVQGDDIAAQTRLTIRISVKYTNNLDHDQDFDTEFSAYADFSSTSNLSEVEDDLIEEIVTQIVDDIFNKSVANW